MTHIDRSIVSIILGRRTVTPCREPVAGIPEVITATDQLHAVVMRVIPTLVVPFRMIRAECLVLRALPLIASLDPIILVEGNRRNLVRPWLGAEIRVLLFDLLRLLLDLLHLLRIGLRRRAGRGGGRILLAGCRN